MKFYNHQPRLASTNLTVNDCGRSQSSRSSLSDFNWSDGNTIIKPESQREIGAQSTEQDSTALLEDYNGVFVLIGELRTAVDELMFKVGKLVTCDAKGDSVHGRLFGMLSEKIADLGKTVRKSGLVRQVDASKKKRRPSASVFNTKEPDSSKTTANNIKTSMASLRIIQREANPSDDDNGFLTAKKRRACFSVKSENHLPITNLPTTIAPVRAKPVDTNSISIDLNIEERSNTQESHSDKKMNYFDIISNLNRMNFIDHEQVIILKKCVIKRDDRVLRPLQVYECNKDLQVLIGKIGTILESCEVGGK